MICLQNPIRVQMGGGVPTQSHANLENFSLFNSLHETWQRKGASQVKEGQVGVKVKRKYFRQRGQHIKHLPRAEKNMMLLQFSCLSSFQRLSVFLMLSISCAASVSLLLKYIVIKIYIWAHILPLSFAACVTLSYFSNSEPLFLYL